MFAHADLLRETIGFAAQRLIKLGVRPLSSSHLTEGESPMQDVTRGWLGACADLQGTASSNVAASPRFTWQTSLRPKLSPFQLRRYELSLQRFDWIRG